MKKPTYDIHVPATVRYSRVLCPAAKLLYGEIKAYCDLQGYCPLEKEHFAALYQVSTKTVTNWIIQLEGARLLQIRYDAAGQPRLLYQEAAAEEGPIKNQLPFNFPS